MDTIMDIFELEIEANKIRAQLDGGMFPNLYIANLLRLAHIEHRRNTYYNQVRNNSSIAAE